MQKILILNASYRKNGVSAKVLELVKLQLQKFSYRYEVIDLKTKKLCYCQNCRSCTQTLSNSVQRCVLDDEFNAIVEQLESASHFVFIVPTNFYSTTAVFKTFQERLISYTNYQWGAKAPANRKRYCDKKALLISSSAAPSLIAKLFFYTFKQLKLTAKLIGAKSIGTINIGKCAKTPDYALSKQEQKKVIQGVQQLVKP